MWTSGNRIYVAIGDGTGELSYDRRQYHTTNEVLVSGEWNHIVFYLFGSSSASYRLEVNGVLVTSWVYDSGSAGSVSFVGEGRFGGAIYWDDVTYRSGYMKAYRQFNEILSTADKTLLRTEFD